MSDRIRARVKIRARAIAIARDIAWARADPRVDPDIDLPVGHAKLYLTCGVCLGGGADTGAGEGERLSERADMGWVCISVMYSCVMTNIHVPNFDST